MDARRRVCAALAAVALILVLTGCPVYYDDDEAPRSCVAFHECSMGCSEQPCIAAWGCVDGQCIPIPMPLGSPCYLRGEFGVCAAEGCLVASYPEPPVITVQAPSQAASGIKPAAHLAPVNEFDHTEGD